MDGLSKAQKIILGVVTIWPLMYIPIFIGFIFSFIFSLSVQDNPSFPGFFLVVFPLHFLTMIVALGTLIFYLIDVYKSKKLTSDNKILWAILVLIGGSIGMVAYWYINVWKIPSKQKKK